MSPHERDRNSALAVARGRARAGDEAAARRWLDLAGTFAEIRPRQAASIEAAILSGRRGYIHRGQIDIEGREAA